MKLTAMRDGYLRKAHPVELLAGTRGSLARVLCAQCGSKGEWRIAGGKRPPPEALTKHFINKGWTLKKPCCPQCSEKQKEKPMATVTPIKTEPTPSPDVRALRRDAHSLIEMAFDIAKGCYNDGYSDARIAKETGLPESWVTKRREDEFGPLKVPGEIGEIQVEAKELASAIGKLQAKLEACIKRNGWAA